MERMITRSRGWGPPQMRLAYVVSALLCAFLATTCAKESPPSARGVQIGYLVSYADGSKVEVAIQYLNPDGQLVNTTATTPWTSPLLSGPAGSAVSIKAQTTGEAPAMAHLNCGVHVESGSLQRTGPLGNQNNSSCRMSGTVTASS